MPQRVHRAARALGARGGRAPARRDRGPCRGRARAAAGGRGRPRRGVVELQAARERAEPRLADAVVACPFKGLAQLRRRRRRRLLRARAARRRDGGAARGRAAARASSGRRAAASRRPCAPVCCPRSPHGVLPGSERWAIALLRPGAHPLRALEQAVAAGAARRAAGDRRRPVRGDVHRLPRRGRADRVRRRARRRRARPAPPRGRADRAARRLLRPLRELPGAVAHAGRQPRAGRPDAPRRAASRDRARPRSAPACASTRARRRADRRRRGRARARCRCSRPRCSSCGRSATAGASRLPPTSAPAASAARSRGSPSASTTGSTRSSRPRARAILVRLAGVGEGDAVVRRRVPLAELERAPGAAEVLAALADGRLVIVGGEEAEVAHEALLREWPRLRAWLEEDAEGRRLHHHLGVAAREWDARRPRPGRALPRRAARRRARLVGGPRAPSSTRSSGPSSTRAGPRASARSAACAPCSPASARCSCSRCVAGWSRSSSAAPRATEATAADAQRLGARALARERPRPLAAARPPGRRARRQPADARQPARRADQEPGRASGSCAVPASASQRSRSAPTGARSPPATTPATSSCSTRGPGGASPRSSPRPTRPAIVAARLQPGRPPGSRSPTTSPSGTSASRSLDARTVERAAGCTSTTSASGQSRDAFADGLHALDVPHARLRQRGPTVVALRRAHGPPQRRGGARSPVAGSRPPHRLGRCRRVPRDGRRLMVGGQDAVTSCATPGRCSVLHRFRPPAGRSTRVRAQPRRPHRRDRRRATARCGFSTFAPARLRDGIGPPRAAP